VGEEPYQSMHRHLLATTAWGARYDLSCASCGSAHRVGIVKAPIKHTAWSRETCHPLVDAPSWCCGTATTRSQKTARLPPTHNDAQQQCHVFQGFVSPTRPLTTRLHNF
jgi:hypothetical protein